MSRTPMVAGNWKMNGGLALLTDMAKAMHELPAGADVVLCPSFPFLISAKSKLPEAVKLGAQNLSQYEAGAHTGEVSAEMLVASGCHYVIVGHSERRDIYGESDEAIAEKFIQAQAAGLIPILCVGETLTEREHGQTESVVARQLRAVLLAAGKDALVKAVVAYEPVWAIGTGETATPEMAQAVHAFLRGLVAKEDAEIANHLRLLYGGSVKADNAALLFAQPDIDGGLIGGASLQVSDFMAIIKAAAES